MFLMGQSLTANPLWSRLSDALLRLLPCFAHLGQSFFRTQSLYVLDRPVKVTARLCGLHPSTLSVVPLELPLRMSLGQLVRDRACVG